MADNLLDKASILLTPTAYNDGSMLSVKPENGDGDFTFSRSSAATRVNAQGLVENVQIISSELVSNGNFSQIGTEEVSNGNFSQEGSELVTNGDFATDSDWIKGTGWSISNGKASCDGTQTGWSILQQNNILPPDGSIVKIVANVSNYSSGNLYLKAGFGDTGFQISSDGTFTTYRVVNGSSQFRLQADLNFVGSIDNVSVKEVGQDWTLDTGWSIGDDKVEADGTSAFLIQSGFQSVASVKSYKIQYEVISTNGVNIRFGGGSSMFGTPTLDASTIGIKTIYLTSNGTVRNLQFQNNLGFIGSITNISVKEVGQDWTLGSGWSIGENELIATSMSNQFVTQSLTFTSGKRYRASFSVAGTSSLPNNASLRLPYDGSTSNIAYVNQNSDGVYSHEFISNGSSTLYLGYGSFTGSITNISLKEITDDTDLPRINYEGFSYQDSLGSELLTSGNDTSNIVGLADNQNINIQSSFLTLNKTYKITFEIYDYVEGSIFLLRPNNLGAGTAVSANGTYSYTVLANASISLIFRTDGLSTTLKLKNISVKEVLGQEVVPDSGCGSWLLEGQSTNLITQSELFSDASWSNTRITITTNTSETLNPSGGNNSELVTQSSTDTNGGAIYKFFSFSATSYTYSIFAKIKDVPFISISETTSAGGTLRRSWFDLQNGTLGSINSAHTAKIESYGNGWYRCSITFTATAGTYSILNYLSNGNNSTTAIVSTGLYIYGAQLEQQSYATSYIPTSGATNTRLQDIATNSGNASLINSTEGVLYAEIAALANDGTYRMISISDGTNDNRITLYLITTNTISVAVKESNTTQAIMTYTVNDVTDFNKIAFKYKENNFALWINGVEVATDTSANVPTSLSKLHFSMGDGINFPFYGKAKALAVYKEALTDAELQSLTTI